MCAACSSRGDAVLVGMALARQKWVLISELRIPKHGFVSPPWAETEDRGASAHVHISCRGRATPSRQATQWSSLLPAPVPIAKNLRLSCVVSVMERGNDGLVTDGH